MGQRRRPRAREGKPKGGFCCRTWRRSPPHPSGRGMEGEWDGRRLSAEGPGWWRAARLLGLFQEALEERQDQGEPGRGEGGRFSFPRLQRGTSAARVWGHGSRLGSALKSGESGLGANCRPSPEARGGMQPGRGRSGGGADPGRDGTVGGARGDQ